MLARLGLLVISAKNNKLLKINHLPMLERMAAKLVLQEPQ